jgi:hypothetical protein
MKFKLLALCILNALIFMGLSTQNAEAKDEFGKIGVGYNGQFANTSQTNGVPGISIKYGLTPRAMIEMIGGFYSGADGSDVAGLKYMETIRSESYANFYFLVGGAFVSANRRSGSEFIGGLGAEFFIPGVDRVGISFETGLSAENLTAESGSFVLKTFGVSFINAGMHYYF